MAKKLPEHDAPLATVSPAYLSGTLATTHTWAFAAIAELIDNAYDPDVNASEVHIDKAEICYVECLTVTDNGRGMNRDCLLRMLSFGYSDKGKWETKYHKAVGKYGNGFKSGSMRLAKDALVFTVCDSSASVGFLSQTFLKETNSDTVRVPMIEYSLPDLKITSEESMKMLRPIYQYSPYHSEEELRKELIAIREAGKGKQNGTGTKIVLFNLKRHSNGLLELDFESDPRDIRNPEVHEMDSSQEGFQAYVSQTSHHEVSEYKCSLKRFCSILFLKPKMHIYIRGKKVKTVLLSRSLSKTEKDTYKPSWTEKGLSITFGFLPERMKTSADDFGVMFYHRNRLIKMFEKVGYQKQQNEKGVGVVGIVPNTDCLVPTQNKQDFFRDDKYNALVYNVGSKLNQYWNAKTGQPGASAQRSVEDWTWVQCDKCKKWRRLPESMRGVELPDKWYCMLNKDPVRNRCDIPEEPELADEEAVTNLRCTYQKLPPQRPVKQRRSKEEGPVVIDDEDAGGDDNNVSLARETAASIMSLLNKQKQQRQGGQTGPIPQPSTSQGTGGQSSASPTNAGSKRKLAGSPQAVVNRESLVKKLKQEEEKLEEERQKTNEEKAALEQEREKTKEEKRKLADEREQLNQEKLRLEGERKKLEEDKHEQQGASSAEKKRVEEERQRVAQEKQRLEQEKQRLEQEKQSIVQEKQRTEQEKPRIEQAKQRIVLEKQRIEQEKQSIAQEKQRIEQEKQRIEQEKQSIQQEKQRIVQEKQKTEQEKRGLVQEKLKFEQGKQGIVQEKQKTIQEQQRVEQMKQTIEQEREKIEQAQQTIQQEKEKIVREKQALEQQKLKLEQEKMQASQQTKIKQEKSQKTFEEQKRMFELQKQQLERDNLELRGQVQRLEEAEKLQTNQLTKMKQESQKSTQEHKRKLEQEKNKLEEEKRRLEQESRDLREQVQQLEQENQTAQQQRETMAALRQDYVSLRGDVYTLIRDMRPEEIFTEDETPQVLRTIVEDSQEDEERRSCVLS